MSNENPFDFGQQNPNPPRREPVAQPEPQGDEEPTKPPMPPSWSLAIYIATAVSVSFLVLPFVWHFGIPLIVGTLVLTLVATNRFESPTPVSCCLALQMFIVVGGGLAIYEDESILRQFR